MNGQDAYDYFFASLTAAILTTDMELGSTRSGTPEHARLQDRYATLQRLLTALDEIHCAV
ncbi:hypothetical protein [Paraburkholderia guartelaensis]|uniref:hypothetical protein n=1 Tax=Paraburkholderia guartelaensis TaxID=2546446 RepID=UPI002AB7C330|nr:hypothetical protein [Paraburkholderia guartelaensis]